MIAILISIILISVVLNIFQFVQIDRIMDERNSYFNIIINTLFNHEEETRRPLGFRQFASVCDREDDSENILHNSGFPVSFRKIRLRGDKGAVRNLHRGPKFGFW